MPKAFDSERITSSYCRETKAMRRFRFMSIALVCALFVMDVGFGATRKPGLWEFTITTTWQKSPSAPGNSGEQLKGRTHTSSVCLTEEMIDKYGALLPQSRGQCTLENKQVKPGRVTADYVCTGMMSGKGDLVSEWSDAEHVTGTIHFIGTLQAGSEAQPIEWTTESKAVFKDSDCGNIKPPVIPASRH